MKSNTENSRKLIEQAIRNLPGDFALSSTRSYLNHALNEINKVEEKRGNRATRAKKNETIAAEQRQNYFPGINLPMMTDKQKIDVIGKLDQMIETEQNKIKKIKETKKTESQEDVFLG